MEQDSRLDGRVALVTGAARRLGAALAGALHRAGASVVVHYGRSRSEADALVATFNASRPGSALALQCDLLVASERARFADTHARVGLVAGWGLSQRLTQAIGPARARYLHFTGNFLDAQTARDWGLVLDVVAPEALLPRCREIARDMLGCDWPTLRAMKRAQRQGEQGTLRQGLEIEAGLSRESLARLDPVQLAQRVQALMARGKSQAGQAARPGSGA